jgi:DNA-binding response OmpR family regulator
MKIAALWNRSPKADKMARAFDERSIQVRFFPDPGALFDAWSNTSHDAILVQDEGPWLRHWLTALRAHVASLHPIVVIGPGDAHAIAQALMWGADDYASEAEGPSGWVQRVLGRIRARAGLAGQAVRALAPYSLDASRCVFASPQRQVRLTARECVIARLLVESHGRLNTADMLSAAVFGSASLANRRSIEQHIYKLRKKCELVSQDQPSPLFIESVYGAGYRLRVARRERSEEA